MIVGLEMNVEVCLEFWWHWEMNFDELNSRNSLEMGFNEMLQAFEN